MLTRYFGDFSTASTSLAIMFMGLSSGVPSLLVEQEDIELLVLAAQPADEIAEQVGVDDPAEAIVPLDEPAELRLGQEAELRGASELPPTPSSVDRRSRRTRRDSVPGPGG